MTPPARLSAAIEILDRYLGGEPLEKALTGWARRSRFAGSGDRAAIRDIVFDSVRRKLSCAAMGGAMTGRGLVLGLLRQQDAEIEALFTGEGHAPAPLVEGESPDVEMSSLPTQVQLDCPEWLFSNISNELGEDTSPNLQLLRDRAPVFVRTNLSRGTRDGLMAALAVEDITVIPHPLAESALEVTENSRRLRQSKAFADGLFDFQDAASQAVCAGVPVPKGSTVLDYCAGGGGKALALADRTGAKVFAHDVNAARMGDIPARAAMAGLDIAVLSAGELRKHAPYDVVFCDVPCSGSGAWRRSPEGKWALDTKRLEELHAIQGQILKDAAELVAADGALVYATCSFLHSENTNQIQKFISGNSSWNLEREHQFLPTDGGDGFFYALLTRSG